MSDPPCAQPVLENEACSATVVLVMLCPLPPPHRSLPHRPLPPRVRCVLGMLLMHAPPPTQDGSEHVVAPGLSPQLQLVLECAAGEERVLEGVQCGAQDTLPPPNNGSCGRVDSALLPGVEVHCQCAVHVHALDPQLLQAAPATRDARADHRHRTWQARCGTGVHFGARRGSSAAARPAPSDVR